MTREEAIEVIEQNRPKKCKMINGKYVGGFPDHETKYGVAIDMAIEALRQGDWIPCSERLPEECDVYWTTVKPNCSYEPFVTTLAYYPSIEEWEDGVEVLAWMPAELPEPYKGENEQ